MSRPIDANMRVRRGLNRPREYRVRWTIFPIRPMLVDMKLRALLIWMCVAALLLVSGCGWSRPVSQNVYERLQSNDHNIRVGAVIEVGRRQDRRAIPYLVDRLEDDEADVRLFSIQALRDITGKRFGYRYFDNKYDRRDAVEKWRRWLLADSGAEAAVSEEGRRP